MRQALRRTLVRLLPVVQSVGPVLLLSVLLLPVLLLHLRVLMGELVLVLHRERTHVLLRDVRREVRALRKVRISPAADYPVCIYLRSVLVWSWEEHRRRSGRDY